MNKFAISLFFVVLAATATLLQAQRSAERPIEPRAVQVGVIANASAAFGEIASSLRPAKPS